MTRSVDILGNALVKKGCDEDIYDEDESELPDAPSDDSDSDEKVEASTQNERPKRWNAGIPPRCAYLDHIESDPKKRKHN